MRAIYPVIFFLALVALQFPSATAAAPTACDASKCSVMVSRVITTNDWGTTFMNDTVNLNITSPVSSFTLGISSSITANLRQISATDSQGQTLQVFALAVNTTSNYRPYEFAFPSPENGTYSFKVRAVLSGLVSFDARTSKFTFSFGAFPVVDKTSGMVRANVTVLTKDWPSPVVTPGNSNATGGKLFLPSTGLLQINQFNSTVWKMVFSSTGTSQNIYDVTVARVINVSQGGSIHVSDTYNVTNRGKDASNIVFALPAGSTSITCSDLIGQLDPTNCPSSVLGDGTVSLTFSPRFTTIKNGGAAVAALQYSLSGGTYISPGSLGRYTLTFQMFNRVKFVASNLQTKIILPAGGRLGSVSGQTPLVSGSQVILQASPVTPYTNLAFSITYQLDPFWSSLAPLGWASFLVGVIAAAALVLTSGPQAEMVGATPHQLITRFVELYDEKSSLRLEGEKLEEDVARGAVAKYDYKRRRRVMDLRLVELDKLLGPLEGQLSSSQSRYAEMMKRIERAEAELQQVRSSLADLKNQNRGGRISRELYDQLSGAQFKRRTRAQQTIDNIVIGLREEAR